jgi:phospholipid/cholesterol/gamma-HCH transport system substrate-binding protein
MLTRVVRWQLTIFALVSIVTITLTAFFYLHVPAFLGFGTYQVVANFPASGGLYPKANVTYRGTTIGVVTAVTLTHGNGVDATMRLNTDTAVPENVTAGVKSVSAVGEQYVDLIPPSTPATASLRDGSHIDRSHTSISGDIAELLRQAEKLVNSVNESRLQDLLRETFTAFNGSGPELARLINSARSLVDEANAHSDDTVALIEGAQPLLDAQIRSGADIEAAADGLARFTTALRQADPNVRATLQTAPDAIDQANATVSGIRPTFPILAANLANFGRIGVIYHKSIEQVLVILPALTAALLTTALQEPIDEGAKADFKLSLGDPPACDVGFIPPPLIRSPADQTLRALPKDLYCKVPQNNPSVVRGARNYPCQEFPGKRAPTAALCRDPRGYVPLGNLAFRGPPVPLDTPITNPLNILPPNKYPNIPPQADYDPGPPVAQLPPGVPPGPGPALTPPYPLQIAPATPGPQPLPLPFQAPPDQQVPPYGRLPDATPPETPPPRGPDDQVPPLPAEAPAVAATPQAQHSAVVTYDPASGQFLDPDGHISVFAAGARANYPTETWVDLMTDPRTR